MKTLKPGLLTAALAMLIFLNACNRKERQVAEDQALPVDPYKSLVDRYARVPLTADLDHLSTNQKEMIRLFVQAADIMDELFWYEAYGKKDSLMASLDNEDARSFVKLNYGPWDRLNDNKPFIPGIGEKPLGANFYPSDMTKAEFEQSELPEKMSLYTLIRRNERGQLISVPYHVAFRDQIDRVAEILDQAASLAEDEDFARYLNLRAEAMRTDDYQASDMAWMDMKTNMLDLVIGPIENYEDKLFNYKAAHEAYILVKDMAWSDRLRKYAQFLPELQEGLPVQDQYKQEKPGTNADLNAYDVVYYAGDCNAGSKTIAINLPNDEQVQLEKGSRRLQLKNAMKAKFDGILMPIADVLINESQRQHIRFDAFFANTMFHEVAHGLGIKNTLSNRGTVRQSLQEHSSALEESKADILGLYMITQLHKKGELEGDLKDYYVTFMAGIFRSVRFGAASAHGLANMIRFNFFKEMGAFTRDEATGTYSVDFEKMQVAADALSNLILTIQGDGNYEAADQLISDKAVIPEQLQADLDRLESLSIPVDIIFDQGTDVLDL